MFNRKRIESLEKELKSVNNMLESLLSHRHAELEQYKKARLKEKIFEITDRNGHLTTASGCIVKEDITESSRDVAIYDKDECLVCKVNNYAKLVIKIGATLE